MDSLCNRPSERCRSEMEKERVDAQAVGLQLGTSDIVRFFHHAAPGSDRDAGGLGMGSESSLVYMAMVMDVCLSV